MHTTYTIPMRMAAFGFVNFAVQPTTTPLLWNRVEYTTASAAPFEAVPPPVATIPAGHSTVVSADPPSAMGIVDPSIDFTAVRTTPPAGPVGPCGPVGPVAPV